MNVFMQTHGYNIFEIPLTCILLLFSSHSHFSLSFSFQTKHLDFGGFVGLQMVKLLKIFKVL